MNHKLKIDPGYLADLQYGKKTFEIRYNDRNYQYGDTLDFGTLKCKVTYVHKGLGLQENYVCMSVECEETL